MSDGVNLTPNVVVTRLWNSIESRYKITFYASIICGLLAHLYQFTNKLFNYDELDATPYGAVAGVYLGRWSQALIAATIKKLFSNTSLPLVNGMLALVFFSLSACIIVKILGIRNKLLCTIVGGLCVTFPTVTCTYFYMYMSWYYALALLLSCISALIMVTNNELSVRENTAKVLLCDCVAVFILAFATGIYQAYYPVAVTLLLSAVIMKCVDVIMSGQEENGSLGEIIVKGVEYIIVLLLGLIVYLMVNRIAVRISGTILPSYQGMDELGRININYILSQLIDAYKNVIKLVITDVYQLNPTTVTRLMIAAQFVCAVGSLILILLLSVKKAKEGTERRGNAIRWLLCILLLCYPIAMFLIQAMSTPQTYVYAIMMYSVIFSVLLPIAFVDRMAVKDRTVKGVIAEKIATILEWMGTLSGVIIVLVYIWFANGSYQNLQYTNYHDMAYYMTMVTQIKSVEGYDDELPIILVGSGSIEDSTIEEKGLIWDTFNINGKAGTNINAYSAINIIREYIGFRGEFLWDDESQKHFFTDIRVIEMPNYPADGSMKIIDNTVVVKLGEIDNNSWQHNE